MATIIDTGRLLNAPAHAAVTELFGDPWQLRVGYGKLVLWCLTTTGGTLKIYRIPNGGVLVNRAVFDTQVIAANNLTAVAYNFRVFKGTVSFIPSSAALGATWIDIDSAGQ